MQLRFIWIKFHFVNSLPISFFSWSSSIFVAWSFKFVNWRNNPASVFDSFICLSFTRAFVDLHHIQMTASLSCTESRISMPLPCNSLCRLFVSVEPTIASSFKLRKEFRNCRIVSVLFGSLMAISTRIEAELRTHLQTTRKWL